MPTVSSALHPTNFRSSLYTFPAGLRSVLPTGGFTELDRFYIRHCVNGCTRPGTVGHVYISMQTFGPSDSCPILPVCSTSFATYLPAALPASLCRHRSSDYILILVDYFCFEPLGPTLSLVVTHCTLAGLGTVLSGALLIPEFHRLRSCF